MKGWLSGWAPWVTLAVLAVTGAGAPSAWATFPGLNGPLAYEAGGFPTPNVFTVQPLAEEDVPGTPTRLTSTDADRDAAWSADGRRIAFMSERDGNAEIYVMNADGSGQTRLTNDPGVDADPTFSPDGQIAFNSTRDGGNPEIYVMNGDGTGQTRLTFDPASDRQADWSPNGDWIAFESNRSGNFDLYAMNRAGGGLTQLTFDSDDDAEASWHPDNTRIAYTSGPEGAASVFTIVPGTPGRTRLTTGVGDWHFPAWSPDAKQIASPPCSDRPTSCPPKAARRPRSPPPGSTPPGGRCRLRSRCRSSRRRPTSLPAERCSYRWMGPSDGRCSRIRMRSPSGAS